MTILKRREDRKSQLIMLLVVSTVFVYDYRAAGQDRLCIPSTVWFGTSPPTLDGKITSPSEWRGAFQAELGPSASPDVFLKGMRDTNNLYLFVEANNLNSINSGNSMNNPYASNLLVLTFDDGAGNYEQIQILPVIDGATAPYSGVSGTISYFTGTASAAGSVNWLIFNTSPPSAVHHPAWLNSSIIRAGYSRDSTSPNYYHWTLEMALPLSPPNSSGLTIPHTNFYKFYVNVFRVVSGAFQQSSWPPGNTEAGCPNPQQVCAPIPPNTGNWGISTIDATQTCSLVNLDRISVSNITNVDGTLIDISSPNTFNAKVTNSAPPPGTGLPDQAKQVSATFSISNFGIPSLPQWQTVPTTNNPTAALNLAPGPGTLSPNPWIVPSADRNKYDPNLENDPVNPSHPHQCIRVQLSSPDQNTAFTNNPAFQNMDFFHASTVDRTAEISAQGYPPRPQNSGQPGPSNDQIFDLHLTNLKEILKPGQVGTMIGRASVPPFGRKERENVASQMTLIVAGCRHTGYFMTINNNTLELCDPVGDFGFVRQRNKRLLRVTICIPEQVRHLY